MTTWNLETLERVSPVLSIFLREWNDDLDNAGRRRLKPYLPRVIGTAGDAAADERRTWLIMDWLVRVHAPAWLDLAKLYDQAASLRGLPPLVSIKTCRAVQPTIAAAETQSAAARVAAMDVTLDAVWAAAVVATWVGPGAAAWVAAKCIASDRASAAMAARETAWNAAKNAAWAAALRAGKTAALTAAMDGVYPEVYQASREVLKPTELSLQESAFVLLDRLIEAAS